METEAIDTSYQTPPAEQYSSNVPANPQPETTETEVRSEEIRDEDTGQNIDLLA
jgi:hypothetical protein